MDKGKGVNIGMRYLRGSGCTSISGGFYDDLAPSSNAS